MTAAKVRDDLVYALRDDLIGPDDADPRDAAHRRSAVSRRLRVGGRARRGRDSAIFPINDLHSPRRAS